jgi:hypothetical protein
VSNLLGADRVGRDPIRAADALADVYSALDERDIAWVLLRGGSERDQADVDLLADPRELKQASEAITGAGFVRLHAPGRGPHRFFVRYLEGDDRWIKLDVVDAVAFGRYQELETSAGAGVLVRRRRRDGLVAPATDDAFWTLLLHCLLDKGRITPNHRRSLAAQAAGAGTAGELARLVEAAVPGEAARLVALARAGEWSRLEEAGTELRREWRRRHGRGARARALLRRPLRGAGAVPHAGRLPAVELDAPELVASACVAALRRVCPLPVRLAGGVVDLRLRQRRGQLGIVIVEPGRRRRSRTEITLAVDAAADPAATARRLSSLIWRAMAARSEVEGV